MRQPVEPKLNDLTFLTKKGISSAILVIAHPDDELFCAGLLLRLQKENIATHVLCLTKGEGGPTGGHPREALGTIRATEMQKSCQLLGVTSLEFLGYEDPVAEGEKLFAPDLSIQKLARELENRISPHSLVISHGSSGEYGHPAHILVFKAVQKAWSERSNQIWITMLAHHGEHPIPQLVNSEDVAGISLDVSDLFPTRLRAMECHQTQLDLLASFANGKPAAFLQKLNQENYCIQAE